MKFKEYQEAALKTAKYDHLPKNEQLAYLLLQLNSEAGELSAEVAKPWRKQGPEATFNRDDIGLELGDILWYWVNLVKFFGYDAEELMDANIEKLTKRYAPVV